MKMNPIIALVAAASIALSAETKTYRVHFSVRGAGYDVIVLAESPSDARQTIKLMYDKAIITGCSEIKTRHAK